MEVARPEVPGELPPQLLEGQHVLSHVAVGASVWSAAESSRPDPRRSRYVELV